MSNSVENNWERINGVFNRLDEIKSKVENDFPSYELVYRVRYFRDQFHLIKNELQRFFLEAKVAQSAEEMRAAYPQIRRNVLFYFLLSEMVFQQFVNDQELLRSISFADDLKALLKEFENKGELVIANLFRNVLAHIRPFDEESLAYEASLLKGEYKVRFRYDVSKSDWKKVIDKVNGPKCSEPKKSNSLAVLKKYSYQIFNPDTKQSETNYSFMPIVAEGIETIFELLNSLEKIYNEKHAEVIEKREILLREEAELEEWLQSLGIGPAQ